MKDLKESTVLKEQIKSHYAKMAIEGKSDSCCSNNISPIQESVDMGYQNEELKSVPNASILGAGCGTPVRFAHFKPGEVVVDLGSGSGIDVFLAARKVGESGKVIGIDMTDEMLDKARKASKQIGYSNVEFRKGDIEKAIPVEDHAADVAISNCVITLTVDKSNTFKEIFRVLRRDGNARMVISDLVSDRKSTAAATGRQQLGEQSNREKWCTCIDGALSKEEYLDCIRKAGFQGIEILDEKLYMQEGDQCGRRRISSITIRADKK